MNFAFTRELEVELNNIDIMFQKSLQPWWEDLTSLRERLQGDITLQLMPAVVVLAYQYLDSDEKLSISMASLFKIIYFANLVHNQVKDEEEGQLNNQDLQFTILIGDYIFGRVLKLLLEVGAVQVLDSLALMICQINEGLVIEHKLGEKQPEILKSGTASIYATAFLTAARLKGLTQEAIKLYEQLGFTIGMALELLVAGMSTQAQRYIEQSADVIAEFKVAAGFTNGGLDKLLQDLRQEPASVNAVAVS